MKARCYEIKFFFRLFLIKKLSWRITLNYFDLQELKTRYFFILFGKIKLLLHVQFLFIQNRLLDSFFWICSYYSIILLLNICNLPWT